MLEQWIEEERVIVQRVKSGIGIGIPTPEQLAGKTGLEIIRGMLSGIIPVAPIAEEMGFCTISVDDGITTFQAQPLEKFLNPMGTMHGGWITTIMDSAMGTAVLSALGPNYGYTTTKLEMEFLAQLRPSVGRVRVGASEGSGVNNRSRNAEAVMYDVNGTIFARAKAVCRVFRTA